MITVTGTARQLERVDRYIATLTRQIKTQVMIDVRILDVRINNNKTYGIDWNKIYGINLSIRGDYGGGIGPGHPTTGGTFTASFTGDLTGVLKFLKTQGDVTVVSSPRVMTLNNQPAMISVGKEIYYEELSTNYIGDAANSGVQDVEAKSVFVGILLDITPEVDERGMITLRINPSISTADEEEEQRILENKGNPTLPPNIKRRQISSIIKVRDGDHAILGGLITKGKGTNTEGVPILGDIPILGYAFKREQVLDYTDELVIIITPHIIKNNKNVSLKEMGYKTLR
jgi:general secretion pathway protein D